MPHIELPHGTVRYLESGTGPPVVFLHGYLMGARLWDPVAHRLAGEFRCIVPELPFGAHPVPLNPAADLTSAGLGRLVADFLQALSLTGVILAGNDSMALGAAAAIQEAGKVDQILLVGFDAISPARALMREKRMLATVNQHADQLAIYGIEYALEILKNSAIPGDRETPVHLVTAETLTAQP